ncbi:MAG: bifunctional metallophosphatase/5'-nucleotidase [bacterium]|nr:bifunctional metallophosphatase/5'-nucleotidase [bacterium]
MILTFLVAGPEAEACHDDGPSVDFWLTVLHNNDGESDLLGSGEEGGIARFATVRRQAERDAKRYWGVKGKRGVVFVSSGDNFLASPEFAASEGDGVFYDARALDMLRYDAIALGNHDFDFGPDVLEEFITEGFRRPGRPPYLSSNLDFSAEPGLQTLVNRGVIAKSTVIRERGERIGIIGATTENLPFISSPRNVVVNEVLPAVQAEVAALESRGIEIIILISHLQDIDGDVLLAESLSGIDIMIAGGGDELLASPGDPLLPSDVAADIHGPYPMIATDLDGNDVPVVTTSGQYGYLGRLVVGFDDGEVLVIDDDRSMPLRVVGESTGTDGVRPNRRFVRVIEDPVGEYVAALESNVIAQTEVQLDGRRFPGVRSEETNEGNLIADSQLWQARQLAADFGQPMPDVALQNGGGIRNDSIIAAGASPGATVDITELDTWAMVPFASFVAIVPDIPRTQFKEILENAVSRTQAGDTPGGTGRFAQVAGFSFVWFGSGTAQELNADGTVAVPGTRIYDVVLDDGTVIVDDGVVMPGADLTIAIVDFLANGGDEYPFRGAPFTTIGVTYQQALLNYIVTSVADGGLGGLISDADYPAGGEGRSTEL